MTIFQVAQNWLAQDPDAETRAELEQLIQAAESDEKAKAELTARFDGRLQFGTAGLRGRLQAGSMGMNRVLVAQAASGLAGFIKGYDKEPSIVIGYDGRKIPMCLPVTPLKLWQRQALKRTCFLANCQHQCLPMRFNILIPQPV